MDVIDHADDDGTDQLMTVQMETGAVSDPSFDDLEAEGTIRAASIEMIYRNVVFGVLAAAVASVLLSITVVQLQDAYVGRSTFFACYICTCAVLHIVLSVSFARVSNTSQKRRFWALAFVTVCCFEGLGWGLAPIGLVENNAFDAELLCMLVSFGVAAGALPAFSPYFPAFISFFLLATIPYLIHSALLSGEPIRRSATALTALFIGAIFGFGVFLNRAFRSQIALRIQAQVLADKLKIQIEIAEAANRAKSTFLAAASHDLRQPVHALGLFVGALRNAGMSDDAADILEHIDRSTQAIDDLFAAILDISKLDAGTVEIERTSFELGPMLERLARECEDAAAEKGIKLRIHHPKQPIIVSSDAVLIERVLRNLLSNAVRYTNEGGVLIGCRKARHSVRVEIWDTGPGIPEDEREAIFQEYYQIGNRERDRSKGLGLGLAIVRRLTSLLGCELTLRSKIGRGSMFGVRLLFGGSEEIKKSLPAKVVEDNLTGRTIVVIDDEADIRIAMSAVLGRWGHEVFAAPSGPDAVTMLADQRVVPDLIIADFRLREGETGIGAIELLRSEYNHEIAAILITGDTAPERLVEAHRSGLLLLHKPVSNSRLRAAVNNHLLAR